MATHSQIQKDLTTLEADLGKLVHHLKRQGTRSLELATEKTGDMSTEALEQLSVLIDKLKGSITGAKDIFERRRDDIEHTVEKHPWTSLAGALGVGLLLGKLLDLRARQD